VNGVATEHKRQPDIERVQALADISRSRYAAIATQPVHRLQIRPTVHKGVLHTIRPMGMSPCNSLGMRPGTVRQSDRQTDRQTRISRRLRLTRNVINANRCTDFRAKLHRKLP